MVVLKYDVVDRYETYCLQLDISPETWRLDYSILSINCTWCFKVIGNDAEVCSLELKNTSGTLKPREKLDIEFVMCAKEKVFSICLRILLK